MRGAAWAVFVAVLVMVFVLFLWPSRPPSPDKTDRQLLTQQFEGHPLHQGLTETGVVRDPVFLEEEGAVPIERLEEACLTLKNGKLQIHTANDVVRLPACCQASNEQATQRIIGFRDQSYLALELSADLNPLNEGQLILGSQTQSLTGCKTTEAIEGPKKTVISIQCDGGISLKIMCDGGFVSASGF
jgi:hypothetical protein